MLRPLIYLVIFLLWVYALAYDVLYIRFRKEDSWMKKLKFLTIINMVLQTLYFGICFIRSFIDYRTESPRKGPHRAHPAPPSYYPKTTLHVFCDFIYATLAFPVGIFVVITFWSLYAIDRELVYPKVLDTIIPVWMNHVMHTAPLPFILVDSLLVCHKYPSRRVGVLTVIGFGALYQASMVIWYLVEDMWVYPFLDELDNTGRAVFFAFATAFILGLYFVGDVFNRLVWGTASHPPEHIKQPNAAPKRAGSGGKLRKD